MTDLSTLRLFSESMLVSYGIIGTPITEAGIGSLIKKIIGKDDVPPEPINVNIMKTDYKKAYDNWWFTWSLQCTHPPKDTCAQIAALIKKKWKCNPTQFMVISAAEFNKEYNLKYNACGKDEPKEVYDQLYYICCSHDFLNSRNIAAFKEYMGVRYFTDIVDNRIRIEMYDNKNYKPKSYINMDNIAAAQQYLDSQNGG